MSAEYQHAKFTAYLVLRHMQNSKGKTPTRELSAILAEAIAKIDWELRPVEWWFGVFESAREHIENDLDAKKQSA